MARSLSKKSPNLDLEIRRKIRGLEREFGPQGWWPRVVSYRAQNTEHRTWVVRHHPGPKKSWLSKTPRDQAFEVAIGAILTQNTAWKNVETALVCLARAKLLTPKRIASARLSKIQSCIRSSGYFRQKARKLKSFAHFVEKDLKGDLRNVLKHPAPRSSLIALWGIGPETADTILLYGLGVPVFVVDAYTRRLLVSLTGDRRWFKRPYDQIRTLFESSLAPSTPVFMEAHALIVAWGKVLRSGR